jgi:hypothetical protein
MSEQQMANYTLTIQADSGYESTTEGRCTAEQYGQAIAALHGTFPAQQVVDSDEKAGAYMEARLWEFIDMAAAWPKASPDPRTWDHVMVYAPKPAQRTWVGLSYEDIDIAFDDTQEGGGFNEFARAIEQTLRSKNS